MVYSNRVLCHQATRNLEAQHEISQKVFDNINRQTSKENMFSNLQ